MSMPNKLSRSKSREKATQPTTNLNDSADDFSSLTSKKLRPDSQVEIVVPATPVNRDQESNFSTQDISRDTIATTHDSETRKHLSVRRDIFEDGDAAKPVPGALSSSPPRPSTTAAPSLCPLCNKQAQPGHLKSCSIKHGLTTQQVVELRRLEDRHREDRRKLGVPEVAVTVSQHKSSRVRVPRKNADDEGAGPDPDLALTLALSISAASSMVGDLCGCEGCSWPPCGDCHHCQDNVTFGGEGIINRHCSKNICKKDKLTMNDIEFVNYKQDRKKQREALALGKKAKKIILENVRKIRKENLEKEKAEKKRKKEVEKVEKKRKKEVEKVEKKSLKQEKAGTATLSPPTQDHTVVPVLKKAHEPESVSTAKRAHDLESVSTAKRTHVSVPAAKISHEPAFVPVTIKAHQPDSVSAVKIVDEPAASVQASKRAHEPSASVLPSNGAYESASLVPTSKNALEPAASDPTSKRDHVLTALVPTSNRDHEAAVSVPTSKRAHEPASLVPTAKRVNEPDASVPTSKRAHEPTASVPTSKIAHEPAATVPTSRRDREPVALVPTHVPVARRGSFVFGSTAVLDSRVVTVSAREDVSVSEQLDMSSAEEHENMEEEEKGGGGVRAKDDNWW